MCTLTIVPCDGIRVVCNRDESRLRPAALQPRVRTVGNRQAVMPIDPVSDGTWIGASDAGLVAVLMNYYSRPVDAAYLIAKRAETTLVSRGTIVPNLLRAAQLDEALVIARQLEHRSYDSFRLVVCDRRRVLQCIWSDGEFHVSLAEPIDRPRFFTSSGLGDSLVAAPRKKLFEECFAADDNWPAAQDAFHRHWWPENRGASVWMTRDNAMTVSRTEVELSASEVRMTYHARVGDTAVLVSSRPVSLSVTEG